MTRTRPTLQRRWLEEIPMADPKTLPPAIAASVDRKFRCGWFYELALLPGICGSPQLWQEFKKLTLSDLEQLTEHYKRKAYSSLERYDRRGSPRTAALAADHIWRAERYRMRYRELLGDERPEDFVDTDPVFPELRRPRLNGD